jgi:hypothetical protein
MKQSKVLVRPTHTSIQATLSEDGLQFATLKII